MRYVVIAHPCTQSQRAIIAHEFERLGAGFWGITPTTWLIVDGRDRSQEFWARKTHEAVPTATVLVLRATERWLAYGTDGEFDWMEDSWEK